MHSLNKRLPIIISIIETLISVPLSFAFPTIYILTSSFAFRMYLIYFSIENPDEKCLKCPDYINCGGGCVCHWTNYTFGHLMGLEG